jgi:hypothetical protein
MARVAVPRDQILDGTLPSVRILCGREASYRRFPGIGAPSLVWILLSPLLGLIFFWGNILVASLLPDRGPGGLPFCDRHRKYWPVRAWIIIGGFAVLVGLMVIGILLTEPAPPGKQESPHWLFGVAGC